MNWRTIKSVSLIFLGCFLTFTTITTCTKAQEESVMAEKKADKQGAEKGIEALSEREAMAYRGTLKLAKKYLSETEYKEYEEFYRPTPDDDRKLSPEERDLFRLRSKLMASHYKKIYEKCSQEEKIELFEYGRIIMERLVE